MSLTPAELAARLGVCDRTAYRLLWRGEIRATKVGGRWRIEESEVAAYLERRTNRRIEQEA